MLEAHHFKYILKFKRPSGTSRGVLTEKETHFIFIWDKDNIDEVGIGECALLRGFSIDDRPDYEEKLDYVCSNINDQYDLIYNKSLDAFPSIRFGLEQAFIDLGSGAQRILFPSSFIDGNDAIPINGLIWMGDTEYMLSQINEKIEAGFNCIKMKISSISFDDEYAILSKIREEHSADELEIRIDANGAFRFGDAIAKLEMLSKLGIHSIEQPIKPKQLEHMSEICRRSPIPVALDEELLGVYNKREVLEYIQPEYIIIKPSLIGGFRAAQEWIDIAEDLDIGWWITSALESNIGLNALAQWTFIQHNSIPQGLGTGSLYTNNIPSPLRIDSGELHYDKNKRWDLKLIIEEAELNYQI